MAQIRGSQSYIWNEGDVLGQGATGAVYKARHKKTGEICAVKTFNRQSRFRPISVQQREFDVCKRLNHPNIVGLLAIEEESHQKNRVLVMELCTGGSLHTILDFPENAFGVEETEFLKILHDIASGMQHIRENDIVHRDIKPGNILKYIGEDGSSTYKLTDFGAARELDDDEQFMSLYGTEEYLYPDMYERAVLRRVTATPFDARVDLWSVGVTLYHVATGQLPFRPFGGRENRDTMHDITTRKESGVLSGVQRTAGGPIEWSRELPPTTALSLGLRLLVTSLLAGLMECNISEMWTFDQFFQTVSDICSKKVIHVFNTCNSTMLHAYMDNSDHLAKFQDALAAQTDIHASSQLLMLGNSRLQTIVKPQQQVQLFPSTSHSNPILLYYCSSANDSVEFSPVEPLVIPKFPTISSQMTLESDYAVAKTCCGILYLMMRKIKEFHHRQKLLRVAVNAFMYDLGKHVEHLRMFVTQFSSLSEEVGKRVGSLVNTRNLQLEMLALTLSDNNDVLDEIRRWEQDLAEIKISPQPIERLMTDIKEVKGHLDKYYERVVVNKELDSQSQIEQLCCEQDESCHKRVELAASATQQNYRDFRRNKTSRQLYHNEEQIHKFEKVKMRSTCQKAESVTEEQCYQRLLQAVTKFQVWYKWATKVRYRLDKMESQVSGLAEEQAKVSIQLDKNEADFKSKLSDMVTALRDSDNSTSLRSRNGVTDPAQDFVVYGKGDEGTTIEDLSGSKSTSRGERAQPAGTVQGRRPRSNKSKTLVRELNNGLQSLHIDTDNVRDSLLANTDLLKQMENIMKVSTKDVADVADDTP